MHRLVLLGVAAGAACASTPIPLVDDEGLKQASVLTIEAALAEAEEAVVGGDARKARALIASSEASIGRELGSHPDRHQLLAHAADLRSRLDTPPPVVAESATEDEVESVDPIPDVVAAFREGPLANRKRALRMIGSAKRAPKKRSRHLYAEARALLESCASEGGRLVESPDLQSASFRVGSRRRTAGWIVVQCRSKFRSIDRRLKKKNRHS